MKILHNLTIVAILLMAVACNSVGREYERLAGSRINFPNSLQRVEGRDTLPYDFSDEKVRLLIYFDSALCNTCAISKLGDWKPIIDSAELINPDFEAVFLLSPPRSEYKKVLREMMLHRNEYNIAIDREGAFASRNSQIPKDSRFHTMLLDRDNRVVVIGDPLYNTTIWNLTKQTLLELQK